MSLTEDLHCGRQVYSITPILKVQSLYNHNMNWETGGNLRHMSLLLQLLSNKDRNPLCLPPWAQSPSSLFITALNGSPAFSFSLFWSRVIFQNVHQVISNFCMKSFHGDRYCCCCPVSILATHLPVVWSIPGVPLALLQQLVIWTLPIWPGNSTPSYIFIRNNNIHHNRNLNKTVYSSIIHVS